MHHHHRGNEGREGRGSPPHTTVQHVSHHGGNEGREGRGSPPHTTVQHVSHHGPPDHGFDPFAPPPPMPFRNEGDEFMNYGPPPPPMAYGNEGDESFNHGPPLRQPEYTTVQHVSHQTEEGGSAAGGHHFSPHMPSFLHPHGHKSDSSSLDNTPTCRVFCKAKPGLSLAVVEAKVVLVAANSSDPLQHWHKDEKYSTQVKDQVGFPSFSLVNKATGQAIKHSLGAGYPVQLTAYNSNTLDESVLWTQGKDLGDGFRAIRMINNIHLNFTPLNADKRHGGIHEGTVVGLGEWKKSDNDHLQWKISHN